MDRAHDVEGAVVAFRLVADEVRAHRNSSLRTLEFGVPPIVCVGEQATVLQACAVFSHVRCRASTASRFPGFRMVAKSLAMISSRAPRAASPQRRRSIPDEALAQSKLAAWALDPRMANAADAPRQVTARRRPLTTRMTGHHLGRPVGPSDRRSGARSSPSCILR